ncbi:MAG: hypothetical protein AAB423_04185 [Patescibacteria group bacterium]
MAIPKIRKNKTTEQVEKVLTKKELKQAKKKKMILIGIGVITLIVVLLIAFFTVRYQNAQKEIERLTNPQEAVKEEKKQLQDKVGKLVALPEGETPTIATVSDVNKLKSQAFFAKAENGDKVLIYTQAKKAVLYRPSINKVIEVAPVNLGDSQKDQAPAPAPAQ